ncbi:MAG: hypothetical protein SFU21_00290 [Flavihumibacter sp.]|nr:hypothetical protein [Flavihumibacter sp.]
MKIHPQIGKFIDFLKEAGIDELTGNEDKILSILKDNGATQTEAVITLHLGFNIIDEGAEKIVYSSDLWEKEPLQDIAYQTFLYMNYNPEDPDFFYDENKVKFSLLPSSKKSTDTD